MWKDDKMWRWSWFKVIYSKVSTKVQNKQVKWSKVWAIFLSFFVVSFNLEMLYRKYSSLSFCLNHKIPCHALKFTLKCNLHYRKFSQISNMTQLMYEITDSYVDVSRSSSCFQTYGFFGNHLSGKNTRITVYFWIKFHISHSKKKLFA